MGNIGNNDTHHNITIDRIGPVIYLESPANDSWSNRGVVFYYNVSDVTSEVYNCSLLIDHEVNQDDILAAEIKVYGAWIDLVKRKLTVPPQKFATAFNTLPKTTNFKVILLKDKN